MADWSNGINRLVEIMLNLANITDEEQETPFDSKLGLGYRAFTSYIRKGCKEIIELQGKYYSACERREYAEMSLKTNEEILEKIFGRTDLDLYNDDELARFKALANEIQKEIDAQAESEG